MTVASADPSRWLVVRRRPATTRLRLFCFPYAGGGASLYHDWPSSLPAGTELNAVQLPGREDRITEPPIDDVDDLVAALARVIAPLTRSQPYALFGHSLGAVLAFELARRFQSRRLPPPVVLIVSGREGPQSGLANEPIYDLPEAEFIAELRRLDATPEALLEHPELMELVLPRLRADFAAADRYRYRPGPKLDCPLIAFGGREDAEVEVAALKTWALETRAGFDCRLFDGDHFFIHSAADRVLASLNGILDAVARVPRRRLAAGRA